MHVFTEDRRDTSNMHSRLPGLPAQYVNTPTHTLHTLHLATRVHKLVKEPFSSNKAVVIQCYLSTLANSIARATAAVQAGRKLTSRDLLTEAERILHKTAGGLSLFERLERDATLRD